MTPCHPFWVKGLIYGDSIEAFSGWVTAEDLLRQYADASRFALLEMPDGRSAMFKFAGPILKTANPNVGLLHTDLGFQEGRGQGFDFSQGYPKHVRDDKGRSTSVYMDLPEDDSYPEAESIETELGRFG